MAKLFAFEEMEETTSAELVEVTPEELEAPGELADVTEETGDIEEHAEAIDEAADAVDDLEDVQDVIKTAADEEGGLSPVAAEAIGIAVRSICARVGVEPKRLYSIYASENFSSNSTRMANTRIAYESISETIRNFWETIKKHIRALWDKIVAFWEKHVAATGRKDKTLRALFERAAKAKSSQPQEKSLDLTGSTAKYFGWEKTVDKDVIVQTIGRHKELALAVIKFGAMADAFAKVSKMVASDNEYTAVSDKLISEAEAIAGKTSATAPLVGGVYIKTEKPPKDNNNNSIYNVKIYFEQVDLKEEVTLKVPTKDELKQVISEAISLNDYNKKMKQTVDGAKSEIKAVMSILDKKLEDTLKQKDRDLKSSKDNLENTTKPEGGNKPIHDYGKYDTAKAGVESVVNEEIKLKAVMNSLRTYSSDFIRVNSKSLELNMKAVDAVITISNITLRQLKND